MKLGSTDVAKVYLGSSEVSKIMLGATEVWSGFDADAAAYFAAIVAAGSTISDANKVAVDAFVKGCKADGIWPAIKACCLLAGPDDLTGALVPLVGTAPTNVNFVSGDYNRTTGLVGDGLTKNLNSNRNHASDPQDNYHCVVFAQSSGTTGYGAGAGTTSNAGMNIGIGTIVYRCRGSSNYQPGVSTSSGFVGVARSSPSGYVVRRNGANANVTDSSVNPLNNTTWIFSRGLTVGLAFSDARLSFYSIGESLDLALLDARVSTYMAALT